MNTTFKRVIHSVSSFAVAASLVMPGVPSAVASSCGFTDIANGNEFDVYVCSLYNAGVVSGVTPTTFEPMRNMTRGEVAKVVVRGKGLQINTAGGPHFTDVNTSSAFYSYVETLYNAGVVSGYGNNTYGVNNPVTRGEFSKMVSKAWNIPVDLTGAPHFSDVPSSNGFYQFIETLKNNNIISGYANGTFGANNNVLRQEVAKMIDRTMKLASTTGFNQGTGARLDVQSNATQVVANGYSTAGITVTSYDKFGAVDESFTDNVTVETTLGEFAVSKSSIETKKAQTGRASFSLTSETAGSANVTAKAAGYSPTTVEVRFTTAAQSPNDGKGPACVTGTGCMDLSSVSDKLLPATNADVYTPAVGELGVLDPVIGGQSLLQAYLYDSNGDPLALGNTAVRCTILSGTGAIISPAANLATAPMVFPAKTLANYLIEEGATGNGRYIANYSLVADQTPSTVKIECVDLLASPALSQTVTVDMKPIVLKTWVSDSTMLTTPEPTFAGIQSSVVVLATTTDQYGDPRTLDCGSGPLQPQVRVTAGPSDGVFTGIAGGAGRLEPIADPSGTGHTYLQGLYAAEFAAGATPGSATVEVRADECIGQPRATTNVTIQEPKMDLFASSMAIGGAAAPSNTTRVFIRITDQNGKPLTGELPNLTANQQSGPAALVGAIIATGADGFYEFPVTLTAAPATAQPLVIRVTNTARKGLGTDAIDATITIQTNPSNLESATATTFTLVPLRTTVGPNQTVPFVGFLRDSRQNGVEGACALVATSTVVGTTTAIAPVGGATDGACFFNVTFSNVVGNTRVQARYTPAAGLQLVQEISFDVRDHKIDLEPINTKLTIGDGSGAVVFVRDEVGDAVDLLPAGAFNSVITDNRVRPAGTPPVTEMVGAAATGVYALAFHLPGDIAVSNFTVRSTLVPPGAVTNPTDSFSVNASPVTISVAAHPRSTITDNCVLVEARVKNASGAPMTNIATTTGMSWEISASTGVTGSIALGNVACTAMPATNALTGGLDSDDTVGNDGVYLITYRAAPIASTDTIRAYLADAATSPEAQTTVTSR